MRISIVTTIYKAEKDLPRLLDSMMSLKSPDLEFFLIDNGSPDRCGEICEEYAKNDNRFFIRTLKDNIGYIRARMLGINECHGDYVGFCDSDDYLEPGGYDHAAMVLSELKCDLYITSHKVHFGDDVYVIHPPYDTGIYRDNIKEVVLPQAFGSLKGKDRLHGFMWKHLYRKKLILESGISLIEDLKPWEDQIFNIDFLQHCHSVLVDNQVIYNYFAKSGSVTRSMIVDFDAEDFWRKTSALYVEKLSRVSTSLERLANANALMSNLDSLVVCLCKKTELSSKTVARTLRSMLGRDEIANHILSDSSCKDLSKRFQFVRYCLKLKLYYLLVFVVRRELRRAMIIS